MKITEITSAERAYYTLKSVMDFDAEEFWALALGPSKRLLKKKLLARGTVDFCLIHPRDVFRFACIANASSLIISHTHPSGDPRPSLDDLMLTKRLVRLSEMIGIPIDDHIIITSDGFLSFAREGLM